MTTNKHNSHADMMTAWQTPAGQLPLDVNATEMASVESLRAFAERHGEIQFAHMCTAALNGEEWAIERLEYALDAIACGEATAASWRTPELDDQHKLDVIRNTDTTRPDGAIARTAFQP